MNRSTEPDSLRVSLEPHLVETLRPLIDIIPVPLSSELSQLLEIGSSSQSTTPTIPYALLQSISRWVRTEVGERALKSKDPPLDPLDYNMVPLLAGTRTSPNKKFPLLSHTSTPSESAPREISDRKAIIAVLNTLLSVVCTGAATWWAAQRTGWRDEWKVLLSLLVATIVAISEITLYIIWESRRERRHRAKIKTQSKHRPIGSTDSCDTDEHISSKSACLDDDLSQSIDPHPPSGEKVLRRRPGIKSKSHSG